MDRRTLNAIPLTPEAFSDYGAVLMTSGKVPSRSEFAGNIDNLRDHAKANLTFIHAAPKPAVIKAVERHEFSNQVFVPMRDARFLVGVCKETPNGNPDMNSLIVFLALSGQAVNYNAGVWHSPLCVIDEPAQFVMLRFDDGGDEDTELVSLDQAVDIIIPD